jgi:hypothetical protein
VSFFEFQILKKTRFKTNPKPLDGIFSSFSNQVQTCLKHDAIKSNYCIHFFTSSNLFKAWCNQVKLLHHYFQTSFNLLQGWCNHTKGDNCIHFSKQVQTCKKHDAIKPIYCITNFQQVPTFQAWAGLGWLGRPFQGTVFFSLFFKKFMSQRHFKNRNPRG